MQLITLVFYLGSHKTKGVMLVQLSTMLVHYYVGVLQTKIATLVNVLRTKQVKLCYRWVTHKNTHENNRPDSVWECVRFLLGHL